MRNAIRVHHCKNGLVLIGEEIPSLSSVSLTLLVPCGVATDPADKIGSATLLVEMLQRGAGPWDHREFTQQIEDIGVQFGASAGTEVSMFWGSLLPQNMERYLEILSTLLLEPRFPEEELEPIRELALQELEALEDEPSSKVMTELSRSFYPEPFGRCQLGTLQGLTNASCTSLRDYYKSAIRPQHAVLGVAGQFDWPRVVEAVESRFCAWSGEVSLLEVAPPRSKNLVVHIPKDTSQLQIALAYPSVSAQHNDYYAARVAASVLSGGMAGRLFIEVREKRGLVYRVSASHSALRGRGAVFAYAGTTPDNGPETLRVMLRELQGLVEGVTAEELERAKADLKARLILQSELSSARASSLVNDWWSLGRVRTLDEISAAITAVSAEDIVRYSRECPVRPVTLVTMGSTQLELPE